MRKSSTKLDGDVTANRRPAASPEEREAQLISLATDLAERQLLDGTAKSQVIVHYLKLGSTKERLEKEILEQQRELMAAKTEAIQSAKHMEELMANAMAAFRKYSGNGDEEDVYE